MQQKPVYDPQLLNSIPKERQELLKKIAELLPSEIQTQILSSMPPADIYSYICELRVINQNNPDFKELNPTLWKDVLKYRYPEFKTKSLFQYIPETADPTDHKQGMRWLKYSYSIIEQKELRNFLDKTAQNMLENAELYTVLNPFQDEHFFSFVMEVLTCVFMKITFPCESTLAEPKIVSSQKSPLDNDITYSAELSYSSKFKCALTIKSNHLLTNSVELILEREHLANALGHRTSCMNLKMSLKQGEETIVKDLLRMFDECDQIALFPQLVNSLWQRKITLNPRTMLHAFLVQDDLKTAKDYWRSMLGTAKIHKPEKPKATFLYGHNILVKELDFMNELESYFTDLGRHLNLNLGIDLENSLEPNLAQQFKKDAKIYPNLLEVLKLSNYLDDDRIGYLHIQVLTDCLAELVNDYENATEEYVGVIRDLITCGALLYDFTFHGNTFAQRLQDLKNEEDLEEEDWEFLWKHQEAIFHREKKSYKAIFDEEVFNYVKGQVHVDSAEDDITDESESDEDDNQQEAINEMAETELEDLQTVSSTSESKTAPNTNFFKRVRSEKDPDSDEQNADLEPVIKRLKDDSDSPDYSKEHPHSLR